MSKYVDIYWWATLSAINVKVVDAGGPLDYALPALIAAAAAVLGAWLTVATANRRHRDQLSHDSARQAAQLDHDRELRDREQFQVVLDAAVERAIGAFRSSGRLDRAEKEAEDDRRKLEADDRAEGAAFTAVQAELTRHAADFWERLIELNYDSARLSLRVGKEHPIVRSHEQFAIALDEMGDAANVVLSRNRNREEMASEGALYRIKVDPAFSDFLDSCRNWVLSQQRGA
jgi:hypothetical protein